MSIPPTPRARALPLSPTPCQPHRDLVLSPPTIAASASAVSHTFTLGPGIGFGMDLGVLKPSED